jgi:hypothetical protein
MHPAVHPAARRWRSRHGTALTHPPWWPRPQVGWKHGEAVAELEEKRKVKAAKFYEAKKKALAIRAKAVAQVGA